MTTRRVLVSVGSDHHPYDRLVRWVDAFAAQRPDVDVFVQYGTSAAPRHASGAAYLQHSELTRLMDEVDVIVTQGGPTGITESRRHGIKPVVAPRHARLGEHVDDHQRAFARFLGEIGEVILVDTEDASEFTARLSAVLEDVSSVRVDPSADDVAIAASVSHFAELVAALPRHRGAEAEQVLR
ncbi:glycosyl transferase family 28 [Phycicoccus endophyticus]|uniref:Glycosyl transferase family 28 n=1 Tax=Phycicoccus endophyticus TaxID=1690220 RepID=A0A7G9R2E9_9MICO|nr:glycosyltransferase [Phycicoccus endophyticus]NHI20841.1 glycosyl transferase family 28 [Phycicoccus endophyticus]QNN49774.1 glycosyl transferase family 28 [Phycicoccus endophyticus]GGL35064.1 hypothetical protein GCM10012283_16830 [Phycicoccus endophyticus]